MSTPPTDPNDRPQDRPRTPGVPTGQGPSQPPSYSGSPYSGPQYSGRPVQPGQPQYPGPQYPGQPGQVAPPGQPGQFGTPVPAYNPTQPGYNPYGGSGGYGYAPPGQLAGWGSRVGASIIDSLVGLIPFVIALIASISLSTGSEVSDTGAIVLGAGYLALIVVQIWNRVIRQGRTGQSIGKSVVGLKIVSADTGELIGMGRTFGRELSALVFNNICPLNVVWPLWDDKHQTWHDKVASDIVVKL